jgi:membrane-bound lytic murein transglycosylase B
MTARLVLAALLFLLAFPARAEGHVEPYEQRPEVQAFIRDLVERHGFVEPELVRLFSRMRRVDPILDAIATPSEKVRTWEEYRALFLTERRIAGGVAFWKKHRHALARAERQYRVPAEYIVAIIGVETLYGQNTGRWRVVEALATLAFDYPPRAGFFRSELENYLLLARDEGLEVFDLRGSYAGAFGIPQFMPSSARRYAVDFDGSGTINLSRSPVDAIGSVANFLRQHGWRPGGAVQFRAQVSGEGYRPFATGSVEARYPIADLVAAGVQPQGLPEGLLAEKAALIELATAGQESDFRLGLHNFYVLTRYNRSALYASAAHELAQAVRAGYETARKAARQEPGK